MSLVTRRAALAQVGDLDLTGYRRADGRAGIRNVAVVAYLVECARHVATKIAEGLGDDVHVIGFSGCYPNDYAARMMAALGTHPNVGAVLLVSLGCEGFDREQLALDIERSGRPVHTLVIQQSGGTARTVATGRDWLGTVLPELRGALRGPMDVAELVVGTICGGSDSTSGLTANPAVGRAFDWLVDVGATAIFEETGELIGCETVMSERAITPELGEEIVAAVDKAERYYQVMGHGSFAAGNAEGGLTTIEEKSLGAYTKSGTRPISGVLKPAVAAPGAGLYLLDVIPDGEVRWGFPNINDNAEAAELLACGAHLILFTTGRGSVVGSAIGPMIKICANPVTYRNLSDDMDVNAGQILEGTATLDGVGMEIARLTVQTAAGRPSASERLGHQEFILTYKSFEPVGPSCLPLRVLGR
ncbi:MAG: UxaA family hydrolase [Phycicoccus sp.]|nr:UxaA family hydrolase [Phycicoccus sp.]